VSPLAIDWSMVLHHLTNLLVAYALAIPIGWERERMSRGVGLRTFPLVATASCGFVLLGVEVLSAHDASAEAHARILYGLMTGIGFIGGGAILKTHGNVSGTATAAAIWTTGAIGAAVGWQRYEIAVVLALLTVITLRLFQPLKRFAHEDQDDDHTQ